MNNKGFTIIEMMAALLMVSLGVMGVFSLVIQSVSYINNSASRLTATYLAQEGIEIVRNIRDSNILRINSGEGGEWDDNLSFGSDYYNFDYRSQSIPDNTHCSGLNYLSVNNDFYTCSSNVGAKFQRKVRINQLSSDKIEVVVVVSWTEKQRINTVSAQEIIYKWY